MRRVTLAATIAALVFTAGTVPAAERGKLTWNPTALASAEGAKVPDPPAPAADLTERTAARPPYDPVPTPADPGPSLYPSESDGGDRQLIRELDGLIVQVDQMYAKVDSIEQKVNNLGERAVAFAARQEATDAALAAAIVEQEKSRAMARQAQARAAHAAQLAEQANQRAMHMEGQVAQAHQQVRSAMAQAAAAREAARPKGLGKILALIPGLGP